MPQAWAELFKARAGALRPTWLHGLRTGGGRQIE
jgi:hypothetical protein